MEIYTTARYIPLKLNSGQREFISSESKIINALKQDNYLGFCAYEKPYQIGFALVSEFEREQFFLQDFLIDKDFQGRGKGREFLDLLIRYLKENHLARLITTTYIFGNEAAEKLYESYGFVQTDIVDEGNIHEVNMKLCLRAK